MENNWKVINDFPQYEINPLGEVRNIKTQRMLKLKLDGTYRLRKDNKVFCLSKQKLIKYTFENPIEDLPTEEWKDIEWYEWLYEVSNMGRIKSLLPYPTLIKPFDNGKGYLSVQLCKEGKKSKFLIHQLVGKAFLKGYKSTDEDGEMRIYINHKNKDTKDNRYFNLEWVSMEENFLHSKIYDCLISNWVEDYPLSISIVEEHNISSSVGL